MTSIEEAKVAGREQMYRRRTGWIAGGVTIISLTIGLFGGDAIAAEGKLEGFGPLKLACLWINLHPFLVM